MDRLFALPVVEELASADIDREAIVGGIGLERMRLFYGLEGRDEIAPMAGWAFRGEKDFELALRPDLDLARVESACQGLDPGCEFLQIA